MGEGSPEDRDLSGTEIAIWVQKSKKKLLYIEPPMYLFFYMAFGLNDFEAGKSLTRAIVMDIARLKLFCPLP